MTIETVLRLVQRCGNWQVSWTPATIAPQLKPGGRLALQTTLARAGGDPGRGRGAADHPGAGR